MNCSCIKKYYDAHISFKDCKTLVYEDQSDWMKGEMYESRPSSYEVRVYLPTKKKEYTITLDPTKRNFITSVELFGTSEPVCLPTDIYCFTVESCGLEYKINRAFLCNTECKIQDLTIKAKTEEDYKDLTFIRNLIDQVKVSAKFGRTEIASQLLQKVEKKLKHLRCGSC